METTHKKTQNFLKTLLKNLTIFSKTLSTHNSRHPLLLYHIISHNFLLVWNVPHELCVILVQKPSLYHFDLSKCTVKQECKWPTSFLLLTNYQSKHSMSQAKWPQPPPTASTHIHMLSWSSFSIYALSHLLPSLKTQTTFLKLDQHKSTLLPASFCLVSCPDFQFSSCLGLKE